jgi:hypothetical protein
VVHGGEHLRARAVVLRQRQALRRRRAPLPEHLDVGVAEAVDRLEFIADVEHLFRDSLAGGDSRRAKPGSAPT